jgi:Glycoside hydrolase 123 N-terminal domain
MNKIKQLLVCGIVGLAVLANIKAGDAIKQPTVPKGFKELPFTEKNPAPKLTTTEQLRGYMLFNRPIIEPVYPNTNPLLHESLNELTAFAAQGEIEPLTFSVYPVRALKNFRVKVSDLKSSRGTIKSSAIDTRLVTYWNIRYPRYSSKSTYRLMPELLERVSAHSSPAYKCQRWWLTVHVSDNTPPGIYTGNVKVWDDLNTKAISIPIEFRVLDFKLLSDPNKRYSAYYRMKGKLQYEGKSKDEARKMLDNEYKAMKEMGINMFPTLRLGWDSQKQRLFMQHADEIDILRKNGINGPLPVTAQAMISYLYRKTTPDGKIGSHWNISKMPPPKFYEKIERAVRIFLKESKDKQWPELYCKPIDEISAKSKEFGAKVFQAIKNGGMKTFTTKNPAAADADVYSPYVDAWCSQPYSVPYKEIVSQNRQEYWCYPNHNGTEIRDSLTMCKGGRMTYGYGFWRSGFNTLMPWHWSWGGHWDKKYARQFDYLRSKNAGSGQRIDDNGEIIFAVNWICFREGVDDNRYIYTLQQAIWSRKNSKESKCRKLVADATAVLQKLWDDVNVQEKYLRTGMWPSAEFNARRWQLATYISKLLKYPIVRKGQAPSVIVNTSAKEKIQKESIMKREIKKGNIEVKNLSVSFDKWASMDSEGKLTVTESAGIDGKKGIRWVINVDHHSGQMKYPIGWPKIRCYYKPSLDFTKYDYLKYMIKVDSDRDEVADDVTPLGFTVRTKKLFEVTRDLGGRQRVWLPVIFNIQDEIEVKARGEEPWREVDMLQLFIHESKYKDKTRITFDVSAIELLRFKTPVISKMTSPEIVLLPVKELPIQFELMGNMGSVKGYKIIAELQTKTEKNAYSSSSKINGDRLIMLNIEKRKPGKYKLILKLSKNGRTCSRFTKKMNFLAGPFYR